MPRLRPARDSSFDASLSLRSHSMDVRVRYCECDPMGVVHHANYAVWFEMGRTEMLRAQGGNYRDLEAAGRFLVVVDLSTRFKKPARYDDELTLTTHLIEATPARLRHGYELTRGQTVLATATSSLACVDEQGSLQPIPPGLEEGG
ncbi:MAG: thioesterase family protein [Phycisphaerales bacterium]|nr:thioesterase family protein [Phycisphaerales bacterium]